MILGVSQASILTNLLIQLQSLTRYTNKLTNHNRPLSYQQKQAFEIEAMSSLNKKVKLVNLGSLSISVILAGTYVYQVYSWHSYMEKNKTEMCGSPPPKESAVFKENITQLLQLYTIGRIFVVGLILIWLITVTFLTLRSLKKGQEGVYS